MIRKIFRQQILRHIPINIYLLLPSFLSSRLLSIALSTVLSDPRKPFFERAFEMIASTGTEGDYLEFGVGEGRSFILASNAAKKYGMTKIRFFAFDSFQGLPESEGETFHQNQYQSSKELFNKVIRDGQVDMESVEVVEGLYSDSLNETVKENYRLKKAAIVHVDCDLHLSAEAALRFVESLIDIGSIIIFDDWHSFTMRGEPEDGKQKGEQKAFGQWPLNSCFQEFYDADRWKAFVMRTNP